ncbi:conserved hypothetical protein [Thermosulfidibacter takaii ABI70S6]|uniref:Uncharacterized protein n=1 Tax=Thermosulfidibacter takaii (strain DSM 17441 / JCM 13301 / NBRC 103674 / ABI70S6) TaxID=1298851 RepID=A0A0S3QW17_THET7|nr:C4-type zinc ribbon domain-containing protein [Thermosulfidibacter takaii]BAT72529.1 conserved hypothetical protein [Thermosulfidibacter takaii ABI70S6]
MDKELEILIKLQSVDQFIVERKRDQQEIPKRLENLKKELEKAKEALDKIHKEKKEIALKRREKEKYLDELAEKIADRKGRLFKVKTNEEYAALLKEIENFKDEISSTEDEIIILLDRDEEIDKEIEEASKKVQELEKLLKEEEQKCQQLIDKIEEELKKALEDREQLWQSLSNRLQRLYEKLKNTKGSAVARAANQTCHGCFTELPPQTFLEVKKGEKLIQCPFCGRILYYWEEATVEQGDES